MMLVHGAEEYLLHSTTDEFCDHVVPPVENLVQGVPLALEPELVVRVYLAFDAIYCRLACTVQKELLQAEIGGTSILVELPREKSVPGFESSVVGVGIGDDVCLFKSQWEDLVLELATRSLAEPTFLSAVEDSVGILVGVTKVLAPSVESFLRAALNLERRKRSYAADVFDRRSKRR